MNATERAELIKQGFIILQPMYSENDKIWLIAQSCQNGSWKRCSTIGFETQKEAQDNINQLVDKYPEYKSEN